MGVEIDEAGADHAPPGVERLGVGTGGGKSETDLGDAAVDDAHVTAPLTGLVEQRAARDQQFGHSPSRSAPRPSRSNSTAIRTATPLVTCCVIIEPGSSEGSTAISTPRFIGPGCITNVCSGSRAARCGVRPKRAVYSRSDGTNASFIRS